MTCDDRRDDLLLHALGTLDGPEQAELRAHLASGCAHCARALAEAEAVVAQLATSADPLRPPVGARDKLMARLVVSAGARDGITTTTIPAPSPRPLTPASSGPREAAVAPEPMPALPLFGPRPPKPIHPRRLIGTAIAAALIGLLVGATSVWFALHQRARLPGAEEVQVVALVGGDTQPAARGRIFWDHVRHNWHVYVFDVKPPPPGRTYQLWFVTRDQKKIPAGTFDVRDGKGSVDAPITDDLPPLMAAAITDEPLGGVTEPTGPIHLFGELR